MANDLFQVKGGQGYHITDWPMFNIATDEKSREAQALQYLVLNSRTSYFDSSLIHELPLKPLLHVQVYNWQFKKSSLRR